MLMKMYNALQCKCDISDDITVAAVVLLAAV